MERWTPWLHFVKQPDDSLLQQIWSHWQTQVTPARWGWRDAFLPLCSSGCIIFFLLGLGGWSVVMIQYYLSPAVCMSVYIWEERNSSSVVDHFRNPSALRFFVGLCQWCGRCVHTGAHMHPSHHPVLPSPLAQMDVALGCVLLLIWFPRLAAREGGCCVRGK